jgi:parvulin-like peptidyl-prolyl isomerase
MNSSFKLRRRWFRTLLIGSLCVTTSAALAQAPKTGAKPPSTPAKTASTSKSQPAANGTPLVAAVVNGQPIQITELAEQCRLRFGTEILEDMISKTIILQACQAQNVTITEKDVDGEISRVAGKFNLSMPMYLKLIEDERGISREQYAADIIWPMLALRGLAKETIAISPAEIDREFQSEFGPKVKVRMIACKDRSKIAQLQQQAVAKPESFKLLAKEHSEDPSSASVEGLLPPIRKNVGDDELEAVAFALQPNEVSKIISAGDMHVILQCVQHLPPANPPAAQMQEIQTRIKTELEDRKLRESAEKIFMTLREKSTVTSVHGDPALERQYPGVAAIVNGQAIPMENYDKALVKRHGPKILEGEINRKLIENALAQVQQAVTQQDVDNEMARAADYFGFIKPDGSADIPRWMENLKQEENITPELYVRDVLWPTCALKKLIHGQVQVTEEDIEKGYLSNYGPRAEVLAIVLSNQRTAQQVWDMARSNPTDQFFGQLANQYSVEESSRSNFGKVPPLRMHGGQPNLEKAAFELKPGELSGIIEVSGRYVILRSQGQTQPVTQDRNAVKNEIYKDILEKKQRIAMDQRLRKLRDDAEVVDYLSPNKSRVSASDSDAAMKALEAELSSKPTQRR